MGNVQSWGPTCDPALVPAALKYDRTPQLVCTVCGSVLLNRQRRGVTRRSWRCPEVYLNPYTGQYEHRYVGGLPLPSVTQSTVPGASPPELEMRPRMKRLP